MKLTKIEFHGYKRFASTECNVDGRAIAFIGPNEAGKTSILSGLEWLTGDGSPLPLASHSRRIAPVRGEGVVRAHYRLENDDYDALQDLNIDPDGAIDKSSVTAFRFSRNSEGVALTELNTTLNRNLRPFSRLAASARATATAFAALKNGLDVPNMAILETLLNEIEVQSEAALPDVAQLSRHAEAIGEVMQEWDFEAPPKSKNRSLKGRLEQLILSVRDAAVAAALPEPAVAIREALAERVPKFILFSDNDRLLLASYNLADENIRNNPSAPLKNLLTVAGTSVSQIWSAVESGVDANLLTLERRINETLQVRVESMWSQSSLTLRLKISAGGLLGVNIAELDSPDFTTTPIEERSDGLRAFLALVCFLVAAELTNPPILLVDEAERNLHYDAQADLMRVLTRDLAVSKVLYTTHSPGCLPLDLGNGIRVVSRDTRDGLVSVLQNNFWTDTEPGFSRLLFAMGAEIAAFSAFRRAVLTEGVSDMILLPTLLRNATDGSELDFQVAFGLSNMSAASALGNVALRTTFLVDGDSSGDDKRVALESAGFPSSNIFALPKNKAIEDLVDRQTYLGVVDDFLLERNGRKLDRSTLARGMTVARAIDDSCRNDPAIGRDVSHKIIASRLAELGVELKLSPLGAKFLPTLRRDLEKALDATYQLPGASDLASFT